MRMKRRNQTTLLSVFALSMGVSAACSDRSAGPGLDPVSSGGQPSIDPLASGGTGSAERASGGRANSDSGGSASEETSSGGTPPGTGGEASGSGGARVEVEAEPSFEVTNPLILERADPWLMHHTDGSYYFIATEPRYERLYLRSAGSIQGLSTAPEKDIWQKHSQGEMGAHIWAPELHFIDGAWYIYFAAGRTDDVWAIRPYVLENTAPDPMSGSWTEKGRIVTDWESFSLDATTFAHEGTRYLVWAQNDPDLEAQNTCIYIAPMSDPWTLSGAQVRLSRPELAWERVGYPVNEGPAVLEHGGRIFLTYSASATDANYTVGLLWADAAADLLDPDSWHKSEQPFMKSGNGVYGPGHSMFTTSPRGDYDVLVFHGRDYETIDGDPLNNPDRHTHVQQLLWGNDGLPVSPVPVANGVTVIGAD